MAAGLAAAQALVGRLDEARTHADKLRALAPNHTAERLIKTFGRRDGQAPRLREGLRLVFSPHLSLCGQGSIRHKKNGRPAGEVSLQYDLGDLSL
jgi:hypothetical protein